MYRAKYDIGVRKRTRGHVALHLPSRVLVTLLSFLFIVSAQLCYAMAHDAPVSDCRVTVPHEMHGLSVSMGEETTAPPDHGSKASNACVMSTCGCIVQLDADLRADVAEQDFGFPPLVAALNGKSPNRDLRPPISLQA